MGAAETGLEQEIILQAMASMHRTKFYGMLALTVLVGATACDGSEETDPNAGEADPAEETVAPQQQMDPETLEQVMEIQEIQQQLAPIQQEALEDEALADQFEALQVQVEAAMREENGEVVDRMERLQEEMAAAEAAGDQERMDAVMAEAQGAQQEMQALQAAVLERPEIRGPVEEFEAAHRARMVEIDPQVDSLLDRMDELIANLPQ